MAMTTDIGTSAFELTLAMGAGLVALTLLGLLGWA
jgi:hypothetical protein